MDALVVLRQLEAAVAERRLGDAQQYLLWLLANLSIHRARNDAVFLPHYADHEIEYLATRIGAAACQLFADADYGLDDETFFVFARLQSHLAAVMGVSGFGSADHVLQNLLEPVHGSKVTTLTRQAFNKILALHGIHSDVRIPYEHYLSTHPRHLLWLLINAVSAQFCIVERENTARNQLLSALVNRIDPAVFDEFMLGWLCVAWMHCSYATTAGRNQIKANFNQMLTRWMQRLEIPRQLDVMPEKRQGKPVMLIINEQMHSAHAMYRCLAPIIQSLRQHFYLVGMTDKNKSDSTARKLFDSHYYLEWSDDNRASLQAAMALVGKIKPHAVYYPSIGMGLPVILLSNLRLAPFQMMSMGHPASSHSEVIDFCLVEQHYIVAPELFSERIIAAENGALGFVPHVEQPPRSEMLQWFQSPGTGAPVRIAIPAAAMKVNAEFIAALQQIVQRANHPVEFHFFPYLNPLASALFRRQLRRLLPNAVVHPPMAYRDYLKTIARCQLHLSPFPFSSTNSLIDSLLLGLPLVVKQVRDTEVAVDAVIVAQAGIPGMVAQPDVDGYVAFACRLIDDPAFRLQLSTQIREADIEARFYGSHHAAASATAAFVGQLVMRQQQGEPLNKKIYSVADPEDAAVSAG